MIATRASVVNRIRNDIFLYLILTVPVLLVLIFRYIPMFGIIISFENFNIMDGFLKSEWVGLKWFTKFLTGDNFGVLMRNTLLINIYGLLWGFPAPIVFALLVNEVRNSYFKKTVQTISYLPYFISTVVAVGMLMQILSPSTGIINHILKTVFGLEPIMFMARPEWFRTVYIASNIWQGMGYSSILYFAAITSIDQQIYEAAEIDGAGRWHKMRYITIPGIIPTIAILFLLQLGNILNVGFEKIILMYNPLTYETADVFDTFVYRRGLVGLDFSFSTAVGLFKSVISFILVVSANKISRKIAEISLW